MKGYTFSIEPRTVIIFSVIRSLLLLIYSLLITPESLSFSDHILMFLHVPNHYMFW